MNNIMARQSELMDCILIGTFSLFFIISLSLLHAGLYPTVFSDEWIYSSSSRLLPLSESISPSYLYLLLFKSTNYCGASFLSCARFINVCFFSAALPFIYLISRMVVSRKVAIYIAVFSLLGPINSYTAYFMPESMYFFSFWVFAWYVLTNVHKSPLVYGSSIGFILSIMSLIKMHAIFLFPAMLIFLGIMSQLNLRNVTTIVCSMIMTFIVVRCSLGYMLAGHSGLNLFGEKYYSNAISVFDVYGVLNVVRHISIPLLGHLATLALFFGVPIAIMFHSIQKQAGSQIKMIEIFALACIISLLFITIFTTVQITGWGPYEAINRIHLRYYNFIFPLFFIIAGAEISANSSKTQSWKSVALLCMFAIYAVIILKTQYNISFIDCPELFGFAYNTFTYLVLSILGVVCLLMWSINRNVGARLYLFLFLPLALLFSNYFVIVEVRQERLNNTDAYDRAGLFAQQYLKNNTSHLTIVGSEKAGLYKTLFYIDNTKSTISELPNHTPFEFAKIPGDTEWVLLIGDYPVLARQHVTISMNGFAIVKMKS